MKILLLSDTHSYCDDKILKYAESVDEIWHAGDFGDIKVLEALQKVKPLRGVFGNIDGTDIRSQVPEFQFFKIDEVSVLMTHIGGYPKKYAPNILKILKELSPKIFICGHSHILRIIYDKELEILHLNPGAVGLYGQQKVRTMLRFEVENQDIKNMEIIEFQK